MTPPLPPEIDCEQTHTGLPVSDVVAAADFYTKKLGFKLAFTWGDPPVMAGVNLGNVQIFLQQGTPNPAGCSVYFVVSDADDLYEFQRSSGVEVVQEPVTASMVCATIASTICTGTYSRSGSTCTMRDRRSRSNAWRCLSVWRSVSPRWFTIWRRTSA
jgi:predicted enzyme related to lactoylglutathione lyase